MSIKDNGPLSLKTGRKPSKLSQAMRAIQFDPAYQSNGITSERDGNPGRIFSAEGFHVRAAATRQEREDAYCFVHQTYEQKGFLSSDEPPLRIKLQYSLPGALTLLAYDTEGLVIGTLSIVPDSDLGLPMSEVFHDDLQRLRGDGKKFCEYTGLCVAGASARINRQVLLNLYRAAWLYASEILKATDICCVVNPRHESFYRKVFFYEPFGAAKSCAHVQDAPGIPLVQNVQIMKDRCDNMLQAGLGDLHEFFFGSEQHAILPRLKTVRSGMPRKDFLYFFMEKTELWKKATLAQKEAVLSALKEPALV